MPLTRTQIVQVALDVMGQIGIDDLTMRRLAAALDVQAGALYRHVASKDQLLAEMADALCADVVTPSPALPWSDQLRALAAEQLRVLRSRRDAARLIAGTAPTGPERLRVIDATLGALHQAGFDGNEAFQIALLLTNVITGLVLEEESNPVSAADPGAVDEELAKATADWLAMLTSNQFPNIQRAMGDLAQPAPFDPDVTFALALDLLLAGIEHHRSRQATDR